MASTWSASDHFSRALEQAVRDEMNKMGAAVFHFISKDQLVSVLSCLLEKLHGGIQKCEAATFEGSSNQLQCITPSSAVSALRAATVSASASSTSPCIVLNELQLGLLCCTRHALQILFLLTERHFRPNQLRMAAVHVAKSSTELSTDEILHLTRIEALGQLQESMIPMKYLAVAIVTSFAGYLRANCVAQSDVEVWRLVRSSVMACGLTVPAGTTESPWFAILQESPRDVFRFRTYDFNRYPSSLSAVMAVATTWEYCTTAWPVLIDHHKQVAKTWLTRFPNSLVVSYHDDVLCDILRIAAASDVMLIVEDIPSASLSPVMRAFLEETERLLDGSARSENFRLVLCTSSFPVWYRQSSQIAVQCIELDETTAINFAHKVLSPVIQPEVYRVFSEHSLAISEAKSLQEDLFDDLLAAAVDPTANAKELVRTAHAKLAHVAARISELSITVQSASSASHIYLAVSHVAYRLYLVELANLQKASFHDFLEFIVPVVLQHLTEGSRHFTKQRGEVVLRFSGWLHSTIASSQELAASSQVVPDSHNALSLCCHCVRRYLHPAAAEGPAAVLQQRRLVQLWDAYQRHVVPLDLVPVMDSEEVELLKRFQRLLMTGASVTSLLREEVTLQTTIASFVEWEGHAREMTSDRFRSLECDAFRYMASAICRLDSQANPALPSLIDPASLQATVVELWRAWSELTRTIKVDVPRTRATAAVILLPEFHRQCRAVEASAQNIMNQVCPKGETDVNQILSVRGHVKQLQATKAQLLGTIPNRVCASPMPTVDLLVEKCLPAQDK